MIFNMTKKIKPFLSWTGSKRTLTYDLSFRLPIQGFRRYHEPFLGGGSLFFHNKPPLATLSDLNKNLIDTYQGLKQDVDRVIKELINHKNKNSEEYYYEVLPRLTDECDIAKKAALFIYLNKTCFQSLHRTTKDDVFNTPWGYRKNPMIVDEKRLRECSATLKHADLMCCDFSQLTINANDFFYFDPPYHQTFSDYNADGFSEDDHVRLFNFCKKIDEQGALFLLSNSCTDFVKNLYQDFYVEEIESGQQFTVNCIAKKELLVMNYKYKNVEW